MPSRALASICQAMLNNVSATRSKSGLMDENAASRPLNSGLNSCCAMPANLMATDCSMRSVRSSHFTKLFNKSARSAGSNNPKSSSTPCVILRKSVALRLKSFWTSSKFSLGSSILPGMAVAKSASPSKSSLQTSFLDNLTSDSMNSPINKPFNTLNVV